jgi:succinate--hydroxymethylglutarate CoA-transferase
MVGFPIHFSDAASSVRLPPPEIGQHTEEVLQGLLGYDWEYLTLTKLKDEEVI